jgi:hypothetical protein
MPGYRHRSRKHLAGHAPALELIGLGLSPVPKRGEAQPAGSDARSPTYLYDWATYPTVGVNTGPEVATLVIEVANPFKFRARVDRGNAPMLDDRWRDLEGCLVSFHGEATAEGVRRGLDKGKLVFRFEGPTTHPLARRAIGHWANSWGVEVFYGKGMPSVLGAHPDGGEYRLEGRLTEAPEWLVESLSPRRRLGDRMPPGSRPGEPVDLEGLPAEPEPISSEMRHLLPPHEPDGEAHEARGVPRFPGS